jgi:hypothetical protein
LPVRRAHRVPGAALGHSGRSAAHQKNRGGFGGTRAGFAPVMVGSDASR